MEIDFSRLPYDISKPGLLIDHYPELLDYKQFSNKGDDHLLKLAIAITDEFSPFVQKEKEFKSIVTTACDYLKINDAVFIQGLIDGYQTDDVEKVFAIQSMYFRLFNKWEYNTWYDLMYQYHENSLLLRTPLNAADKDYEKKAETKQKIRIHQIELQKNLVSYENQIFPKSTNIKKVLTKQAAIITNWPEKMAKDKPAY